jgi:hypothetical protein
MPGPAPWGCPEGFDPLGASRIRALASGPMTGEGPPVGTQISGAPRLYRAGESFTGSGSRAEAHTGTATRRRTVGLTERADWCTDNRRPRCPVWGGTDDTAWASCSCQRVGVACCWSGYGRLGDVSIDSGCVHRVLDDQRSGRRADLQGGPRFVAAQALELNTTSRQRVGRHDHERMVTSSARCVMRSGRVLRCPPRR